MSNKNTNFSTSRRRLLKGLGMVGLLPAIPTIAASTSGSGSRVRCTHQVETLHCAPHDPAEYCNRGSLLDAIEVVLKGKLYLSKDMRERMLDTMLLGDSREEIDPVKLLSIREMEVLCLLGQGFGVSEIAQNLNLSVKTINVYRDNIRHKLSINDAGSLRRFAIQWVKSNER